MPNILSVRIVKNIVISMVMLSAGVIFGISSHSIYVAIIPILFGLMVAGASIKMFFDWKRDKIVALTAVCLEKHPKLFGKSTYIFNVICCSRDKWCTFTLNNVKDNCFVIGEKYDFLFNSKENTVLEQNLIDYTVSYINTSQEMINKED